MLDRYDFDITFDDPADDVTIYNDMLAKAAERMDWLEDGFETGYDITVEGGDLSDMLSDGVAEIQVVGGTYDKADSKGNYFIEHAGAHIPLENREVASFDIDAAIAGGGFSSVPGMSDVYRMVDGGDEMYAASIDSDTASLSGPALDDIRMEEPEEQQYKVRFLDDTGGVLDASDWHEYTPQEGSMYEELNDAVPGQTKGLKEATKEVGQKYMDGLRDLL